MGDYAGEVDVLASGDIIRGAGVKDSVLGITWLVEGALGTRGRRCHAVKNVYCGRGEDPCGGRRDRSSILKREVTYSGFANSRAAFLGAL